MNYNIDEFINKNIADNSLNNLGNDIFLSNKEIETLDKYHINYHSATSLKEIISRIEDVINEYEVDEINELDLISLSISERDYYQNTNK